VAAIIWGHYAALLGFIGGKSFEDDHTLAFVIAFVSAFSITLLIELIRFVLKRARYRQSA
jgi:membrane protein DedA with SNARE-associated domain